MYKVNVPMQSKTGDSINDGYQHMVLLHELAHALHTLHPDVFKRMMNTDNLAVFSDRQPPWRMAAHPHFREQCGQTTIPVQLSGDDVPIGQSQSLPLILWCSSAAFKLPSMLARLMALAMPMRNTTAASFEGVYSILVWSLSVMARGVFPFADHAGAEWAVGSIGRRRGEAATWIAGS